MSYILFDRDQLDDWLTRYMVTEVSELDAIALDMDAFCSCPKVHVGMKVAGRNLSPSCPVHALQEAEAVRRLGFTDE